MVQLFICCGQSSLLSPLGKLPGLFIFNNVAYVQKVQLLANKCMSWLSLNAANEVKVMTDWVAKQEHPAGNVSTRDSENLERALSSQAA